MKLVPVAARPHSFVVIQQQIRCALLASSVALSLIACDGGSSVAPTPVPQTGTPPPQAGPPSPGPPSPSVPTAPYMVTGTVTDSKGATVAGAEVWIYGQNSPIDNRYAAGTTDSAGHYTLGSPQRAPQHVRALKSGYITRDILTLPSPVLSTSTWTWTVDVPLQRIVWYALLTPTRVKVGQSVRMEAQVNLDDGSSSTGLLFTQPSSSDPAVVHVESTGWVIGVAPGTAFVTTSYYGVSASILIRVDP